MSRISPDASGSPKPNRTRLGIWLAGIYLFLAVALFILTAMAMNPSDDGLEWTPFWFMALPWSRISPQLLFPGFLFNAVLLFSAGTGLQLLGRLVRRLSS